MKTLLFKENPALEIDQYLIGRIASPWGGNSLIVSSVEDEHGWGNLIPITYDELTAIIPAPPGSEGTYIVEYIDRYGNPKTIQACDILFIGSIEEWAKDNDVKFQTE